MTDVLSEPRKIQQEAVQGGAAVSESLLAEVGGTSNFILDNFIYYPFGINGGVMSGLSAYPYIFDGSIEPILLKCTIENIVVYLSETGTSGQTEFRIERQLAAGGGWTSIFSVNAQIGFAAADGVYFNMTDLVPPSGVIAPVLSISNFEKNDKLRFVLVSSAIGAKNLKVRVVTRPLP